MSEVVEFYAKDRAAWRKWLEQHHENENAVWLIFDKGKNRTLTWRDIVQESLCFGWIDSTAGTVSDSRSKLYVSKRKPKSGWSKINKAHVEELLENGMMDPAGQAAIDLAKQNGSWDALTKSDNLELPPKLIELFKKNLNAANNFDAFSNSAKRIILQWIYSARREETTEKRIEETVRLAEQNIKAH